MLFAVYAMFFASTNLCYHVHWFDGVKVVHSHLYLGDKAHSHSAAELLLINLLGTTPYEQAETVQFQSAQPAIFNTATYICEVAFLPRITTHNFSLRAPPYMPC